MPTQPTPNDPEPTDAAAQPDSLPPDQRQPEATTPDTNESAAASPPADALQDDKAVVIPLPEFVFPATASQPDAVSPSGAEQPSARTTVQAPAAPEQPTIPANSPATSDDLQRAIKTLASQPPNAPSAPGPSPPFVPPVDVSSASAAIPNFAPSSIPDLPVGQLPSATNQSFPSQAQQWLGGNAPGVFKIGPAVPDALRASQVDARRDSLSELRELHAAVRPPDLGTITVNYSQAPPVPPFGGAAEASTGAGGGSSSRKPLTNLSIVIQTSLPDLMPAAAQAVRMNASLLSQMVDQRIKSEIEYTEARRRALERAANR